MSKKAHWENVYQHKLPDEVSWYQQTPTLSIELITSCSLSKETEIIDVGGGASTLVDKGVPTLTGLKYTLRNF